MPWQGWIYTNLAQNVGAASYFNVQAPLPQGIVELIVNGGTGQQSVHDNFFVDGAVQIICEQQHFRIFNTTSLTIVVDGEHVLPAQGSWISTNMFFVEDDVAVYFNTGGNGNVQPVFGFQLALGIGSHCLRK